MSFSREHLLGLIQNPSESLSVELKRWFDPESLAGRAKIAKACIALRNENGGCVVIGLTDDGQPDDANTPVDVRAAFHFDKVQHICSRSVSKPFSVTVEFVEHADRLYPVICVPSGVETPVASRLRIVDGDATLLAADTVYVRSINRGVVSSAPAGPNDWDKLAKTCFDNREADIGAFVRRHLQGADLGTLTALLIPSPSNPTPAEMTSEYLEFGRARFEARWEANTDAPMAWATREAGIVVVGEVSPHDANERFLNELLMRKPRHSGWTPWLAVHHPDDQPMWPNIVRGGWEAFMHMGAGAMFGPKMDFWRLEPDGRFYCLRVLETELHRRGEMREVDFTLEISCVAEIMSIASSFAQSLGCDEAATQLAFAFRWTGVANHWLTASGDRRHFCSRAPALENEVMVYTEFPLEVPNTALTPWVERVVRPLFALFGGTEIATRTIDEIVTATIQNNY